MFNVHEVKGDTTKALIEIDIFTLVELLAGYGRTRDAQRKEFHEQYGLGDIMSSIASGMTEYSDAKLGTFKLFAKYFESQGQEVPISIKGYIRNK